MPNVAASADQLAAMSRDAEAFQAYVMGPAATAVLARYMFWFELRKTGLGKYGFPVDLTMQNSAADAAAVQFAQAVVGLNGGQLELAHWTANERDQALTLGIVRAGQIHELGWAFVPVIVVGVLAAGAWVLVNAWLSVRTLEAQSDALRAKTAAAVSDAVARVGATDPAGAAMLADALERANAAASGVQPGLLDKLAGAVGDVGKGIRDSGGLLLLLGAAWLWSRRKAA